MDENLLHFVWQNKLFDYPLQTVEGESIEVLHPGFHSYDSGADFTNAKVRINDKIWVGNVEIHINSSDWYKHKHNTDRAYDNVILHVVKNYDKPVFRTTGETIPALVLEVPQKIQNNYAALGLPKTDIKCEKLSVRVPYAVKLQWLDSLLIERLENLYKEILHLVKSRNNSWDEAFYIRVARNFGQKLNNLPFELLAKSLESKLLRRNSDDRLTLEALLFGQAGMLSQSFQDEYFIELQQQYKFLQTKYHLQPLDVKIWKFFRIRPHNFPTIRISQFADLISRNETRLDFVLEQNDLETLQKYFSATASDYWDNHYKFGQESSKVYKKCLTNAAVNNLLINAVVPFMYAYGRYFCEQIYIDRAMELLAKIEFEQNKITRQFSAMGFPSDNAAMSQAMLELYKSYCQANRCIKCRIGAWIMVND